MSEFLLDELDELRAARREATRRREELWATRNRPDRKVRAAEARLAEAAADAEAEGREADTSELAAELARVREATEAERAEIQGRIEGADRALREAEAAIPRFVREHRPDLIAELVYRALEDRDELLGAIDALRRTRWGATAAQARELAEHLGAAPSEVPPNPLGDVSAELERTLAPLASGVRRDPRRFVPVPSHWLPEE